MKTTSVPVDLLRESLATMKKQAAERDDAMEKLASAEGELHVAQSVLELVRDGVIDPTDSLTKFAEFSAKPELLEFTKQAAKMGYTSAPGLGELVLEPTENFSDMTPESRLQSRLESL